MNRTVLFVKLEQMRARARGIGGCRMVSVGDQCTCDLCVLDAVIEALETPSPQETHGYGWQREPAGPGPSLRPTRAVCPCPPSACSSKYRYSGHYLCQVETLLGEEGRCPQCHIPGCSEGCSYKGLYDEARRCGHRLTWDGHVLRMLTLTGQEVLTFTPHE